MKKAHTEAREANQKCFTPKRGKGHNTSAERKAVRTIQGMRNDNVKSTKISKHTEASRMKGDRHRANRFLKSNQRK